MSFQINDGDWWYGTGLSNKIIRLLIDKLAKNCPVKQSFKKRRTSAGDIFQAGLAADRPGRRIRQIMLVPHVLKASCLQIGSVRQSHILALVFLSKKHTFGYKKTKSNSLVIIHLNLDKT